MSLFERINNKIKNNLIIEMNNTGSDDPWDDKDTKTENKKKANQKKKFNKKEKIESGTYNYSKDKNKNKKPTEKELANRRRNPELNRQQRISRMYDAYDDGDLGNPGDSKAQTTTQTSQKTPPKNRPPKKGTDYFFDAEKAKKAKDEFRKGRKAYTDSTSGIKAGKVTQKGIVNYITKARNLNQGTNANTKANRKAAEIIAKSSGSEYAEKIRQKYETDKDLSRKRGKNQPSYAEVKKGIDKNNPTYLSPTKTMGVKGDMKNRPLPLSTRKTKTKVKTPPPYKRIETKVTDKEIQDLIKKGKEAIPKKSTKVTPTKLANVDKAIKNLDDLIIGSKPGEEAFTKKALRKQQRVVTKKITTPSKKEIEQSQKILDKTQTKPKVKTPPKVETPKVETPPKTQTAKQFDGKSFDDFIKDAKKKNKAAQQSIQNIKVDPVTKFGSKVTVGNEIPYTPKRIPNPERVKKIKDYRSMLKSQPKYLRNISKFSRKNPRLRGAAVVLGTLGAIAGINKLATSGTKKPTPVVPLTKKDVVPLTANLNLSKGNRPTFTPTKPKNT